MFCHLEDEIVVKDIRFEKYANVTFDKDIYKNICITIRNPQKKFENEVEKTGNLCYNAG